jgi:hypothetical protein
MVSIKTREKTNIRTKGFACVQFYKTKSTAKTVLLKVSSAHIE